MCGVVYFIFFLYFALLLHDFVLFNAMSMLPLSTVIFFLSLLMLSPCYFIYFFPLRGHFLSCVLGNILLLHFWNNPTAILPVIPCILHNMSPRSCHCPWQLASNFPPLFFLRFLSAVISMSQESTSFLVFEEREKVLLCMLLFLI